MNQRRSSLFVSISVHAIVLAAVLVTPLFAPLPMPTLVAPGLAWAPTRVVQPVDLDPPTAAHDTRRSPTAASSSVPTPPSTPAPIEPPIGVIQETGHEAIGDGTRNAVSAVERGGGSAIDGVGITETPPSTPPSVRRQPIRPSSGIRAPRKTVDVAPQYPAIAREGHVEGVVILEVIIDERGNVTSTRLLKSMTLLDQAAIDAVRQWKFTPTLLNNEPIPIVMTVTVSFRLQ